MAFLTPWRALLITGAIFWKFTVFNGHPAAISCNAKGHGAGDDYPLADALGGEPVIGAEVRDVGLGMREHLAPVYAVFYG